MAENTSIGGGGMGGVQVKACGHLWMILKAIPIQKKQNTAPFDKNINMINISFLVVELHQNQSQQYKSSRISASSGVLKSLQLEELCLMSLSCKAIHFIIYSKTFILHAVILHFACNSDSTIHFFLYVLYYVTI